MSAEEAKTYGLIDNVITSRGEIVDPQIIAAQAERPSWALSS
jgi:ATP-dependent protease ClpP protease subunit